MVTGAAAAAVAPPGGVTVTRLVTTAVGVLRALWGLLSTHATS